MTEPAPEDPVDTRDIYVQTRAAILDEGRPAAVAKQRAKGRWTARERVAALLDAGSLSESGMFAQPLAPGLAAPADGVITGIGTVDGAAVAVVAYDYTALGGTQGQISHRKLEHLFRAAARERCPVVIFAEGGGARWQELEPIPGGGTTSFVDLARLSASVPLAAAITGHAFAGHANLAALCDLVVATADATMGIGGPPLVEAALGMTLTPQEIGPMSLHQRTGAVDLVVADDAAVLVALRRWLRLVAAPAAGVGGYRPEPVPQLRTAVPVNPRHAYDVRSVISLVADAESLFELRGGFAANVVTAFIEVGGLRAGVIANQPRVLAGAIDSNGSDKMARFISLCDALDVPILFLIDTPGFMVGAPAEQTALVRHSARVLQALAGVEVPIISVVLRKAYGLAYYAMGSPPFGPAHCVAWPSAEFGGMGLLGAANIAQRGRDDAEPAARDQHVADLKDDHTVWRAAARYAIDEVIDPADTRDCVHRVLVRQRAAAARPPGKRHIVDAW